MGVDCAFPVRFCRPLYWPGSSEKFSLSRDVFCRSSTYLTLLLGMTSCPVLHLPVSHILPPFFLLFFPPSICFFPGSLVVFISVRCYTFSLLVVVCRRSCFVFFFFLPCRSFLRIPPIPTRERLSRRKQGRCGSRTLPTRRPRRSTTSTRGRTFRS